MFAKSRLLSFPVLTTFCVINEDVRCNGLICFLDLHPSIKRLMLMDSDDTRDTLRLLGGVDMHCFFFYHH